MKILYPTITKQILFRDKLIVLEVIRDLDEAIELICAQMTEEEKLDPFAEDLCPYFGILWPAAVGLATHLDRNPELVKGKTVLELGCGLGLPSLLGSHLGGKVLATDFHPDVEEYFVRNCRHSSLKAHYQRLNWREETLSEKFDVVMGSDVLYESKHASEVAQGLIRFLKPGGTILLSDPGRAYLQKFVHAMTELGFRHEMSGERVEDKEIFVFRFSSDTV